MQNILKIAMVAGALGLAAQAKAVEYSITFSGSVFSANGQIDVSGGVADSGYLTVAGGPDSGTYSLVALGSPLINGDVTPSYSTLRAPSGDQIFDDVVYVGSNPFLTGNGLEFANSDLIGFNLWGNGPGYYSLFASSRNVYVIDGGNATLTAVVPDGGLTAGLLGGALLGLGALRRKLQV
jgi:hypothetical protein